MKPKNTNPGKVIIFDSGVLINFAINGLLDEFRRLKEIFNGKFIITKEVKGEIIDKPITIKRFELEALKIQELLADGILEMSSVLGVDDGLISQKTSEIQNLANSTFYSKGNSIQIIEIGESSCMALSRILDEKGVKNVIAVDERTTRLLGEKPENLETLLKKKTKIFSISSKKENFKLFKGFTFIRSAELIYIAYKKGLVKLKNHDVLDALLYAMKLNGCSISDEEIFEMKKL